MEGIGKAANVRKRYRYQYRVPVSDRGDRGLFVVWTWWFCVKILVPFPLSISKFIGDFIHNRERAPIFSKFLPLSSVTISN